MHTAMAFSNSKPLLLQTQNHVSPLLMILIFSFLLLNNVSSQSYPSSSPSPSPAPETVGFGLSFSAPQDFSSYIALAGDASIAGGALQLTRKDIVGNPIQNSVGRALYRKPVHIWDKTTGNLADFTSSFTFIVDPKGAAFHGDGFAFFLGPVASTIPANSNGAYLGLFSPQTAISNTNNNQIVAVEFDTYVNDWDPPYPYHIGIDVNSINSTEIIPWPPLIKGLAAASINYNSESKNLTVSVFSRAYPSKTDHVVSHVVDLRTVLPEWVSVGFSAATGQVVETHDIHSWSFEAAL